MPKRRRNPNPGICRVDQPKKHRHGFSVRVQRHRKIYSAFFSDRACGGRRRAFTAAQGFLRELRQIVGPLDRRLLAQRMAGYGKSGITGVSRIVVRRLDGLAVYWQARWSPEPYGVRRRVFSVAKYGERQARQMAIRARQAGVRAMQ